MNGVGAIPAPIFYTFKTPYMYRNFFSCKVILVISIMVVLCGCGRKPGSSVSDEVVQTPFSLEELQKRTFNYFWELADTVNFQMPDRYPTKTFSSIAATGFGLSAYLVGIERGYITRASSAERVLQTLQVLASLPQNDAKKGASGYQGFYYHFLQNKSATRYENVELSSIDTGLLMAGILSIMSYFDGKGAKEVELRKLADSLYRRVNWNWMMADNGLLSMGWKPESGFLKYYWNGYSEGMILYILALGSPTFPIPQETWSNWTKSYQQDTFQGQAYVNHPPLFIHQYAQMYIDFRNIKDQYMQALGIDYFENSRRATYANRDYCIQNSKSCVGYGANCWGLTACDGPPYQETTVNDRKWTYLGYSARGVSVKQVIDDGTIAPTAAGGSMPFAPEICEPALANMWDTYYQKLVGLYGFKDAFNLTWTDESTGEKGWFDKDYLGIDQGAILLQIENYQSELIWKMMRKNPYIINGLKKAGFEGGWLGQ